MEQTVFELDLLEEARDFLKSLTKEIRGKIGYNIRRVQKGERDNELFKKLDGTEIWEFRTIYNKTCYRLFAFWDKDINTLVVATHGIVKKTQKRQRVKSPRQKESENCILRIKTRRYEKGRRHEAV